MNTEDQQRLIDEICKLGKVPKFDVSSKRVYISVNRAARGMPSMIIIEFEGTPPWLRIVYDHYYLIVTSINQHHFKNYSPVGKKAALFVREYLEGVMPSALKDEDYILATVMNG